jgi:hypothetical protein
MLPQWLRRRREARRLAQADAEAPIRDYGAEAYGEARQRERNEVPKPRFRVSRFRGLPRSATATYAGNV